MSTSPASRTVIDMEQARSARSRPAAVAGAFAKQSPFFTIPVTKLLGFPLVVLFFATRKTDFELDAAFVEVQIQRSERVARAFEFTDETVYLDPMHQLRAAGANRFDLPALERDAGLEFLLDKVVVVVFFVFDDGH